MNVAISGKSESWDSIRKRYPDSFVLLVNPEYSPRPYLQKGVFVYKNKNRKNVYEKAIELNTGYSTVNIQEGRGLMNLTKTY
ncbi:MAG: hypothetical protein LBT50_00565 [Prevotellaceae bacterium]|jgi:hypothetical protein|nr:hypothetical protein [Prevotellaceae bacterium]